MAWRQWASSSSRAPSHSADNSGMFHHISIKIHLRFHRVRLLVIHWVQQQPEGTRTRRGEFLANSILTPWDEKCYRKRYQREKSMLKWNEMETKFISDSDLSQISVYKPATMSLMHWHSWSRSISEKIELHSKKIKSTSISNILSISCHELAILMLSHDQCEENFELNESQLQSNSKWKFLGYSSTWIRELNFMVQNCLHFIFNSANIELFATRLASTVKQQQKAELRANAKKVSWACFRSLVPSFLLSVVRRSPTPIKVMRRRRRKKMHEIVSSRIA